MRTSRGTLKAVVVSVPKHNLVAVLESVMAALPEARALGPALRRWRALNRVKQSAVADELGISQTTISRWESRAKVPEPREARRLTQLLTARPTASSDLALIELVRAAPTPMHLICDLTHRLIAASPGRLSRWRVSADELVGTSLWRFATQGIRDGESALETSGWYEPLAADVMVRTERIDFPELTILAGEIRYTRMPLADGGFARLVRTEPSYA